MKNGFTFYTYSTPGLPGETRWDDTGIPVRFFKSHEEARNTALHIRESLADDPGDTWRPLRIEKIDMLPVTKDSILALLNDGVGALVANYEIVEVIE